MRSGRGSAGRCAGGAHRERDGARQALAISSPEGSALTGGKLFTAANAAAAAALPPFIHRNVTVSLHPRPGDRWGMEIFPFYLDRKSTRLNSSHTVIYTLSLHDALPICRRRRGVAALYPPKCYSQFTSPAGRSLGHGNFSFLFRSEEHTSELQSHSDLHSFPTRRSSDLPPPPRRCRPLSTEMLQSVYIPGREIAGAWKFFLFI